MVLRNRWLVLGLTGGLLASSLFGPLPGLHAAPAEKAAASTALVVSINRADAEELERVKGIGPMLAERIVQYRETQGRFERLEDLVNVPGIGQAKFERLKSQISL